MSLARDVTTMGSATLARGCSVSPATCASPPYSAPARFRCFLRVLQIVNFFRRLLAEGALNAAFVPLWLRIKPTEGRAGAQRFLQQVFAPRCSRQRPRRLLALVRSGVIDLLRRASAATVKLWQPTICGSPRPMSRSPARRVLQRYSMRRLASLRWPRRGDVQRSLAACARIDRRLRRDAAVRDRRDPCPRHRARRDRATPGDRRRLPAAAAHPRAPRFAPCAASPAFVPPKRGISSRSPSPAYRRRHSADEVDAGAMIASSSPAAVSWLYYANRLYELPLGVISIATASVLVPAIAASVRSGDSSTSRRRSRAASRSRSAWRFPPRSLRGAGGADRRRPVRTRRLRPRDTAAVAAALTAICAGFPARAREGLRRRLVRA